MPPTLPTDLLHRADVLLVTATEVATRAVFAALAASHARAVQPYHLAGKLGYDLGLIAGAQVWLVRTELGTTSAGGTLTTVSHAIDTLRPLAVLLVGSACGLDPTQQRIGDVLISKQLMLYDLQAVTTGTDGLPRIHPRGDRPAAAPALLDRVRHAMLSWPPAAHPHTRVKVGLLLSGDKQIDHPDLRAQLRRLEPEALGGEMAGAGLYLAASARKVDWMLISAISDWADGSKPRNQLQRQERAAQNAAAFTLHVLGQGGFVRPRGDAADPTDVVGLNNPYLGLTAFTANERHLFAGRAQIVQALVTRLAAPHGDRLLFIIGASGSGKSSLVRAGLLPALADLDQASVTHIIDHPGRIPATALERVLAACRSSATPGHGWVFIDQFEELFTQANPEERARMLSCLAACATQPSGSVRVLATMRSDFLHHLLTDLRFEPYARRVVVLRAMTERELHEAIQRPIQACYPEKRVEPALLTRLAEDAAPDAAYLPLLQVTLEDLWRGGSLRLAAYRGLADAIQRRADAVASYRDYDGLQQEPRPPAEQQAILDLCCELVRVAPDDAQGDVRQRRQLAELTDGQAERRQLITALTDARLLRTDHEAQGRQAVEVVDLIHERLLHDWPRLRDALSAQRQLLQQRRRFELALHEWEVHARTEAYLLTGVRLSEAQALSARRDVALRGAAAQALLAASQAGHEAHIQAELQRQRALTEAQRRRAVLFRQAFASVAALLVVVLAAAWLAIDRQQEAQRRANEAATSAAEAQRHRQQAEANAAETDRQRQRAEASAAQARTERDRATRLALSRAVQVALTQNTMDLAQPLVLAAVQLRAPETHTQLAITVHTPGLWHILRGHTGWVWSGLFGPDGQTVLSASADGTLRLWDVTSGQTLRLLAGHTAEIKSGVFSPDGQTILSASADGTLRLWDVASGQTLHVLTGHTDTVNSGVFSPDGQTVLSASADGTLRLWDVATGQTLHILTGHTDTVNSGVFSPDGQTALSASTDGTLRLWSVTNGQTRLILWGHTGLVWSGVFSPDGQTVLSASTDGTLRLWNVTNGQTRHVLAGHTDWVNSGVFSPDGQTVLSTSDDRTLRLWDVKSGQSLHTLMGHTDTVRSGIFSPDGETVLSASEDGTLRLWDVRSGQMRHILVGHTDTVTGGVFSPDGQLVLSTSEDGTLRLWDVRSGQTRHVLEGHTNWIRSGVFSPDGQTILSASDDHTLRLWDVASGQILDTLLGHTDTVKGGVFSPDGQMVLSTSVDGTLRLWNSIPSGDQVAWLCAHRSFPDLTPQQRKQYSIPADLVLCPKRLSSKARPRPPWRPSSAGVMSQRWLAFPTTR